MYKSRKIIYTSVALGFLMFNNTIANATLKNRVGKLFTQVLNSNFGRGNYKLTDGLKFNTPNQKLQAKELIKNKKIVGNDSYDFNPSGLGTIFTSKYYHQNKDSDGELITLISKNKPLVKDINESSVTVVYVDNEGIERKMKFDGLPIWVEGAEIIIDFKKKKNKMIKQESISTPNLTSPIPIEEQGAVGGVDTSYLETSSKESSGFLSKAKSLLNLQTGTTSEDKLNLLTEKKNKRKK